jgi:hypothetical protein
MLFVIILLKPLFIQVFNANEIVKLILVYKIEIFAYNEQTRIGHVYLLGVN